MARVVLTQPAPRVETIAARLRERGHEALAMPLTRIVPREDNPALQGTIARLDEFDFVILVSPAAVQSAARLAPDWPCGTGVAVVGPGSRAALADAGFRRAPARVLAPEAPPYDGASLAALPPLDAPGLRVLVLRGETGSDGWIETLRARGARVDVLAVYRNEPVEADAAVVAALHRWLDDDAQSVRFVVTQSSTVARLDALLRHAGLRERAMRAPALAIHPRIVSALRDIGWRDVRSIEPGERALGLALESASDSSSRHGV